MRVLVVDDYPGAAEVACVLLRLLGHEPLPAVNGTQALERAATFEPDVIVLDLGLPDVSGYDVARELRLRTGKRPFIAAMTGWCGPDDRVRSLAAGIDMHVLKPASADNLGKIIVAAQRRLSDA
jgi:two-component system, chemotaxis family, CheB/CheR fusion protein